MAAAITAQLQTIHPNPGPRDKTEEGKKQRRKRRQDRRREKRREKEGNNTTNTRKNNIRIITWNVQKMSLGTVNKRKAKQVANMAWERG